MSNYIRSKKGICIGILSVLLWGCGLYFDLLGYKDSLIVLLILLVMFFEISKLIVEMVINPDAPIKIRYVIASMIMATSREFYISLIEHEVLYTLTYTVVIGLLIILRWSAIQSTKELR